MFLSKIKKKDIKKIKKKKHETTLSKENTKMLPTFYVLYFTLIAVVMN
jgi:hypothetical protein